MACQLSLLYIILICTSLSSSVTAAPSTQHPPGLLPIPGLTGQPVAGCQEESLGGMKAPEERFHWMVSLRDSVQMHSCSAVLIDPLHILTAAHCVDKQSKLGNNAVAYVSAYGFDDNKQGSKVQVLRASLTCIHPTWDSGRVGGHDIALLKLPQPVQVPSAALPPAPGKDDVTFRVTSLGWGHWGKGRNVSCALKASTNLELVNVECCTEAERLGMNLLCVTPGAEGSCPGDLGSPLLLLDSPDGNISNGDPSKDVIYGLLSFVTNATASCGAGTVAAYTRLDQNLKWMTSVMVEKNPEAANLCYFQYIEKKPNSLFTWISKLMPLVVSLVVVGMTVLINPDTRYILLNSPKWLRGEFIDQVTSLQQIGSKLYAEGKYCEAKDVYEKALEIQKRTVDGDDPRVAITLNGMGRALCRLGEYDKAEHLHLRALGIQEATLGVGHREVGTTLNDIGMLMFVTRRIDDAQKHLSRALEIRKRELAGQDPLLAESMNNLGMALINTPESRKAKDLHRDALDIQKTAIGTDCIEFAGTLHLLGTCLMSEENFPEAEKHLRRGWEIQTKMLPVDHADLLRSMTSMGLVLRYLGCYDESAEFYRHALETAEMKLGKEHAEVARTLSHLGAVLCLQKSFDEARNVCERALTVQNASLRDNDPEVAFTIGVLGEVARCSGNFSEAEEFCRKSIEIKKSTVGEDHRAMAPFYNNLGLVLEKKEDFEEAEKCYRKALSIWREAHGDVHSNVALSMKNVGRTLEAQGKLLDANEFFRRASKAERRASELNGRGARQNGSIGSDASSLDSREAKK